MVLGIAEALASSYFPTQYTLHIVIAFFSILALLTFSQGRRTTRERDLHARTVLLTGGFTPLGLTVLQSLAQRGAHVIALSLDPIESENVSILIDLLRNETSNEQIFAEQCDLTSPSSVRSFCTKFLTGKEQRLDAIIFAHEYQHIGVPRLFSKSIQEQDQRKRDANSLATFLITTLLLPALLVAPAERDIRVINVVNPFYAAAAGLPFSPSFSSSEDQKPSKGKSILFEEGRRSLRTIVFTRHLQRVLDALPAAQVPKTDAGSKTVPVVSSKAQKSNIVAISASPGISRVDTISSLLNADFMSPSGSIFGLLLYVILQPILRIFAKSPFYAMQTIFHVLCLPTPFKIIASVANNPSQNTTPRSPLDSSLPEEVLRPGALYADCASVKLRIKIPEELVEDDRKLQEESKRKNQKKKKDGKEEVIDIKDDGEYGGELAGRLIWEEYEGALKIWEKENPGEPEKDKGVSSDIPPQKPSIPVPKDSEDADFY